MDKREILKVIKDMGLTLESVFIPYSKSRNAEKGWLSLNWKVTLKCNGREVITTDYSAGSAHCPSHGKKLPTGWDKSPKAWPREAVEFECESGYPARFHHWARGFSGDKTQPILPSQIDVIHSLVTDSDVIDYRNFEEWANEFGYDPDSRSGEKVYNACLQIALGMRAGIGEAGMQTLREAFQDY